MKKTLIALAALAATASFAQSSVTLSGNLDFASMNVSGTQAGIKGSTIATSGGATSSTSVIRIIAVEDLGDGMKATAAYGIDPRTLSNDGIGNTLNNAANTANAATANTTTGFSRDELFVGLSGSFGNIRLGSPNSIGLNAWQPSSSLGTGIGSGYTGRGVPGTMTNSFVQTRYSRSVRYDSPVMGGFQVAVLYAAGNDEPANGTTALNIINARQATEFGLRYDNGPLTVAYANVAQGGGQVNKTGWYSGANTAVLKKTSADVLSVSFKMGDTTLHAGMNDGDRLTANTDGSAAKSKGSNIAITQNIGAIGLMAGIRNQKVGAVESKVTGLRADYNLSKTAAVYIGYENYDTGAATANDAKLTSIGLRKSF